MLHEYTNNKSSKGYDKFSFERWLETREGEEGERYDVFQLMNKMRDAFPPLRIFLPFFSTPVNLTRDSMLDRIFSISHGSPGLLNLTRDPYHIVLSNSRAVNGQKA